MAKCIVCGKKGFFLQTKFENVLIANLPSTVHGCKECSVCSICGKKSKECKTFVMGYGPKFYCEEHESKGTNLCSRCLKEKPANSYFKFNDEAICKDCGKCIICGKNDKVIARLKKGSPIYCQEHKDQIGISPAQSKWVLDNMQPELEEQDEITEKVPELIDAITLEDVDNKQYEELYKKLMFNAKTIDEIEAVDEKVSKKFIFKDMRKRKRQSLIESKKRLQKMHRDLMKPSKLDLITTLNNPSFGTAMAVKTQTTIQRIQRQIDDLDEEIRKIDNDIQSENDISNFQEKNENSDSDPIKVLKMRYAKGEISKSEYHEMLDTLTK